MGLASQEEPINSIRKTATFSLSLRRHSFTTTNYRRTKMISFAPSFLLRNYICLLPLSSSRFVWSTKFQVLSVFGKFLFEKRAWENRESWPCKLQHLAIQLQSPRRYSFISDWLSWEGERGKYLIVIILLSLSLAHFISNMGGKCSEEKLAVTEPDEWFRLIFQKSTSHHHHHHHLSLCKIRGHIAPLSMTLQLWNSRIIRRHVTRSNQTTKLLFTEEHRIPTTSSQTFASKVQIEFEAQSGQEGSDNRMSWDC